MTAYFWAWGRICNILFVGQKTHVTPAYSERRNVRPLAHGIVMLNDNRLFPETFGLKKVEWMNCTQTNLDHEFLLRPKQHAKLTT